MSLARYRFASGFAVLLALILAQPLWATPLPQMADKMMHACFYEEAYIILRRLVKEDPNNPEIHYSLAACLNFMGRRLRAVQEYQICLRLAPDGPRASECHDEINTWEKEILQKGEKYTLSNLDIWFKEYYDRHPYNSWEEDPEPEWAKKANEREVFAVDVHLMSVRPQSTQTHGDPRDWHRWFLRNFHDLWEKNAQSANVSGVVELYVRMHKNGHLEPIIVWHEGHEPLDSLVRSTLASFDNNDQLRTPCSEECLLKAHLSAGVQRSNVGTWYAFTEQGPARPVLVSISGTFSKNGGFRDSSATQIGLLPMRPVELTANPQLGADDEAQLNRARQLIDHSNYNDVLDILWPMAARDVPEACLLLARAYSDRNCPDYDTRMAALWWEQAAKFGYAKAQYCMGCIYEWGNGNSSGGMADGVNFYKLGADQGSADCFLKLGILSEFGDGVPFSNGAALSYYSAAARQGNKDAIAGLSRVR